MEGSSQEKTINITPIIFGVVLLAAGVTGWLFLRPEAQESQKESAVQVSQAEPERGISSNEAMEAAIARAKEWSKEAKLLKFFSQEGATGNKTGKSELWTFLFTSEEKPGKSLEVEVKNSANSPSVQSVKEVQYESSVNAIQEIAPDDIITQEEAVAKVREIPGYENVKILGVEAEYGPLGKIWYWNVKTDKAGVSIHALRSE